MAAIDADDRDHLWAKNALTRLPGSFLSCEACITEAVHLVENHAEAVRSLMRLIERVEIISFADSAWRDSLAEVIRLAPRMDYADACVVSMVRARRNAFALTLDRRDFATYRVPFACPVGDLYL